MAVDADARGKLGGGPYAHIARSMLVRILCAVLVPSLYLVLILFGIPQLELETSVTETWTLGRSPYAKDKQYYEDVTGGTGNIPISQFFAVSAPRDGGDHARPEILNRLVEKMADVELNTDVTVGGITYTYDDFCAISSAPYIIPCLRYTAIDAFHQGGYNWNPVANSVWVDAFLGSFVVESVNDQELSSYDGAPSISGTNCYTNCTAVHTATFDKADLVEYASRIRADPTCHSCVSWAKVLTYDWLEEAPNDMEWWQYAAKQQFIFEDAVRSIMILGAQGDQATIDAISSTTNDDLVQQYYALFMAGMFLSPDVSNPYTYQIGVNLLPFGYPRPDLNSGTAANLDTLFRDVYWYDEGTYLGALPKSVIVSYEGNATSYSKVPALAHMWLAHVPKAIQRRVGSPYRPGGPISISEEEAEEALKQFKMAFEDKFNAGWDNDTEILKCVVFTDDVGAPGTAYHIQHEVARNSYQYALLSWILTIICSVAFLANCDCVNSDMVSGFFGTMFSVIALGAALGFLCAAGQKLTIVHLWTLPFLMVGLGVDDMFVITLAFRNARPRTPAEFAACMNKLFVPVTTTSAVNSILFMLMLFVDLKAVQDIGTAGAVSILFLWLINMSAFPALLAFEMDRKNASRPDVFCCMKVDPRPAATEWSQKVFLRVCAPLIRSKAFHCLVGVQTVSLLAVGFVGCTFSFRMGIDVSDFAGSGSSFGEWAQLREQHFGLWMTRVNWGELTYRAPDTQMEMVSIWEKLGKTDYTTELPSNLVWTANYAVWGTQDCYPQLVGECGRDHGCFATWEENTKGLKLTNDSVPGVCKAGDAIVDLSHTWEPTKTYCPVFKDQSDDELAFCLARWANFTSHALVTVPGFMLQADGVTPQVPIRWSQSSGDRLMSEGLYTNDDYVDLLEVTRPLCDEHATIHCWLSGTAYDFWEQYLTLEGVMLWTLGGTVCALYVFTFCFFAADFVFGSGADIDIPRCKKIMSAFFGAGIVFLTTVAALFVVVGQTLLLGVKLSGFSIMTYLMCIGFAVEFTVHTVHGFLLVPSEVLHRKESVLHVMSGLFMSFFLAYLSSFIGVASMGFSDVQFVRQYFFTPLVLVVVLTYHFGCIVLPVVLTYLDSFCLRHGGGAESAQGATARAMAAPAPVGVAPHAGAGPSKSGGAASAGGPSVASAAWSRDDETTTI